MPFPKNFDEFIIAEANSKSIPEYKKLETEGLKFQVTCVDHFAFSRPIKPSNSRDPSLTTRLYGRTMDGLSVCCMVPGQKAYLCVAIHSSMKFSETIIANFKADLETQVYLWRKPLFKDIDGKEVEKLQDPIPNLHLESSENGNTILKIEVAFPELIPGLRHLLETGRIKFGGEFHNFRVIQSYQGYQYDLFVMKSMRIKFMSWITLSPNSFYFIDNNIRSSTCNVEVFLKRDFVDGSFEFINIENSLRSSPLRLICFDLECMPGGENHKNFPKPSTDPIIQISAICKYSAREPQDAVQKFVFVTGSCESLPDATIFSFDTERDLVEAWAIFLQCIDPDFIAGYNIFEFDIPYVLERGRVLGLHLLKAIGRIVQIGCFWQKLMAPEDAVRKPITPKGSFGMHMTSFIHPRAHGRLIVDLMQWAYHHSDNYNFRNLSLSEVSKQILQDDKENIAGTDVIWKWQNENAKTRKKLAEYCLKDSFLVFQIIERKFIFKKVIAHAKQWVK